MGKVNIEVKEYKGWKNCIHISNGIIEAIATTDVGPRIIHFGLVGGQNAFAVNESQAGTIGGEKWKVFGGHRLWHSPEVEPKSSFIDNDLVETRCSYPDNSEIEWKEKENGIILTQLEPWTFIRKEIEFTMHPDKAEVTLLHRLVNDGAWTAELAVWALSVMAAGGKVIIPQVTRNTGHLPNRMVSLWPYSRMDDARVCWGEKYITVQQDVNADRSFKLGLPNEDGWAAYANNGLLFIKKYQHFIDDVYPDYASSYETFTDHFGLEMETLSPLVLLEPGETIEHVEMWSIFDNIKMPVTEKDIDEAIIPLI